MANDSFGDDIVDRIWWRVAGATVLFEIDRVHVLVSRSTPMLSRHMGGEVRDASARGPSPDATGASGEDNTNT